MPGFRALTPAAQQPRTNSPLIHSVGFGCDNPYALYEATNPDAGTKSPPGTPSPTPAK